MCVRLVPKDTIPMAPMRVRLVPQVIIQLGVNNLHVRDVNRVRMTRVQCLELRVNLVPMVIEANQIVQCVSNVPTIPRVLFT